MKTGTLIHIETGVEYYKDGSLYTPTFNEKLMWSLFGTPSGVERFEQTFETEIDEIIGFTKQDIQSRVNENFKNGAYNYLPVMGINHSIELRF